MEFDNEDHILPYTPIPDWESYGIRPQHDFKESEAVSKIREILANSSTTGWKALINDPDIDSTFKINKAVACRRLLWPSELFEFLLKVPYPYSNCEEGSLEKFTIIPGLQGRSNLQFYDEETIQEAQTRDGKLLVHTSKRDYVLPVSIRPLPPSNSILLHRDAGNNKDLILKAWKRAEEEQGILENPFERDCLFSSTNGNGGLNLGATSYMDSSCNIPRCMSLKYLKELGLESQLSTDFEDPGLISLGQGEHHAKMTGIVRGISFRIKGSSMTFRGDFFISETLDTYYDVLFGWQFMLNEAADILEKARKVYQEARTLVGRVAGKVIEFAAEAMQRVSNFAGGSSSPPPPPYSLVDVRESELAGTSYL